jgi:hypothetical protein
MLSASFLSYYEKYRLMAWMTVQIINAKHVVVAATAVRKHPVSFRTRQLS